MATQPFFGDSSSNDLPPQQSLSTLHPTKALDPAAGAKGQAPDRKEHHQASRQSKDLRDTAAMRRSSPPKFLLWPRSVAWFPLCPEASATNGLVSNSSVVYFDSCFINIGTGLSLNIHKAHLFSSLLLSSWTLHHFFKEHTVGFLGLHSTQLVHLSALKYSTFFQPFLLYLPALLLASLFFQDLFYLIDVYT